MPPRLALLAVALLSGCAPLSLPEAVRTAADPAPAEESPVEVIEYALPGEPAVSVAAAVADPGRVIIQVIAATGQPEGWETSALVGRRLDALAAINGGYFDEDQKPLGLLVSAGRELVPLRATTWPVFLMRQGLPAIVSREEATELRDIDEAVQCGPRLVVDGRPTKLKESAPSRRSAVGLDAEGRVLLVASSGGLALARFAELLAAPRADGGFGCRTAMNLDGGPSSQFWCRGRINLPGAYPMPSHLVFLPRPRP